ncbi:hypothetical protein ACS0TY_023278 [Phlomoides rotata]
MYNTITDLSILSSCGIRGQPSKAPKIRCITRHPPPYSVMKINVDGGASGALGELTGGGVFRDNYGVFRG